MFNLLHVVFILHSLHSIKNQYEIQAATVDQSVVLSLTTKYLCNKIWYEYSCCRQWLWVVLNTRSAPLSLWGQNYYWTLTLVYVKVSETQTYWIFTVPRGRKCFIRRFLDNCFGIWWVHSCFQETGAIFRAERKNWVRALFRVNLYHNNNATGDSPGPTHSQQENLWSVQVRGGVRVEHVGRTIQIPLQRIDHVFMFTANQHRRQSLSPKGLKSRCLSKLTSNTFYMKGSSLSLFHPEQPWTYSFGLVHFYVCHTSTFTHCESSSLLLCSHIGSLWHNLECLTGD